MKVLYISHDVGLDGAQKSLMDMLKSMKDKDIMPIVTLPSRGALEAKLYKMGVSYKIIPYINDIRMEGRNRKEDILTNIRAVVSLIWLIHSERIDLIHTNSSVTNVGAMAAYLCNKPHIWHLREFVKEHFGWEYNNRRIKRMLFQKSDAIITISDCISAYYKNQYNLSSYKIYDGLHIANYHEGIYDKHDMQCSKLLIVGSVSMEKGQIEAIEAVKILRKKNKDVLLTIVGRGSREYLSYLKKYVKEHDLSQQVTFKRYIDNLRAVRKEHDIALVCSRMEALGRVTAEAMLAGMLVIGANTGGTRELIGEREQRGYLYQQGNATNLAERIIYVQQNSEEALGKRKEAQHYIKMNLDNEQYARKIIKLYHRILREKRRE